ncbi:normocyte-binding protein [Paenibacillus sp. NRS-1782]|uniref:normocyte-binding protein n=1 Tax=unclassified Paenibacillus TaxID=185978 RepID=UPI003D270973
MKELVQDRLSKMEDLEQRRLLKNMMAGVFMNLVEYQEEMTRQLERRVFEEIENTEEKFDVYVSLTSREDYDPIHEFLYPVLPSDTKDKVMDISRVAEVVREGGALPLFTLFLEMETEQITALVRSKRVFGGTLVTETGSYPIRFRLEHNRSYILEIEKLYLMFMQNGMPWKTINHPYAYKFVDCVLVGGEGEPDADEEIHEITISLEEFDGFKKVDVFPLWNIERLSLKNSGFPIPAIDHVNYEHVLPLSKTGPEHGYLIDGAEGDIRYIKRTEEELTIVTPRDKSGEWNVLKVTKPVLTRLSRQTYPVLSNRRQDSFLGRYAGKQAVIVRAKAEITRIVHSFEAAQGLELERVDIWGGTGRNDVSKLLSKTQTYPLNPFVSDNVRTEEGKQIMRLGFRHASADASPTFPAYILSDLMSFLVSEVQMYFPEYKCEGEWL